MTNQVTDDVEPRSSVSIAKPAAAAARCSFVRQNKGDIVLNFRRSDDDLSSDAKRVKVSVSTKTESVVAWHCHHIEQTHDDKAFGVDESAAFRYALQEVFT